MLTNDAARILVEDTIRFDLRHAEYENTVEIARLAQIFMTGKGQPEEFLLDLRDKETDRQKLIRVKVTKPITPFAMNPVKTQFQKMYRVDGVAEDIGVEEGTARTVLSAVVDTYQSGETLSSYLQRRQLWWLFNDPNGWHITERRNVYDGDIVVDVDVYPFEVNSEQAVNVGYDNGQPQWLIVEQKRIEYVRRMVKLGEWEIKETEVSDFYLYTAGLGLKYSEFVDVLPEEGSGEVVIIDRPNGDPRQFVFSEFKTGSTEFPGEKWGCFHDPEGSPTLSVPPYWEGSKDLLERLVIQNSIFQVSAYNHVFPKLFHYDYKCGYSDPNNVSCEGGYMGGSKLHQCPKCKGTGGKLHVSESDVITFQMPTNMEDLASLPDLQKLAYYHEPPLPVTEQLYQWVKDLVEQVYLAAFNVANVEKSVFQRTATEIDMLSDNINIRVYPAFKKYGQMWERAVRLAAQYKEIGDKAKPQMTIPADMRLEGLDVLVDRYQRMKAAGVSYEALWTIHCAILAKTHTGNQVAVENVKAWEYWKPFKSYEQNLTLLILQDRSKNDRSKILYENWDEVKMEVERKLDKTQFYTIPTKEKQKELIDAAIEVVRQTVSIADIDNGGGFGFGNDPADETTETEDDQEPTD
jgi:hypothetical protein